MMSETRSVCATAPCSRIAATGARALLLAAMLLTGPALAAPPEGADPNSPVSEWFKSLRQPGTQNSCCDLSDCRGVRSRIGPEGYEVLIERQRFGISEINWLVKFGVDEPQWVKVPDKAVLSDKDNPLGQAVVCWTPGRDVICFVRPVEG